MSKLANCIHHQPNAETGSGWICAVGAWPKPGPAICEHACTDPRKTPDPAFVPRAAVNHVVGVNQIVPKQSSIVALPRDQWPLEAIRMSWERIDSDKGLGDVAERLGKGERAEYWCGVTRDLLGAKVCKGNQRGLLNRRYPFKDS